MPLLLHTGHKELVSCSVPVGSPDSCPLTSAPHMIDPSSISHPSESSSDWPIAIRKGIRSTRNCHPIYNFELSLHISFVSSLSSITIPKNVQETLDHLGWRQAMIVEM